MILCYFFDGFNVDYFIFLAYIAFSLSCIWFSDILAPYANLFSGERSLAGKESPGWMVRFTGWLLLLLPAAIYVITKIVD